MSDTSSAMSRLCEATFCYETCRFSLEKLQKVGSVYTLAQNHLCKNTQDQLLSSMSTMIEIIALQTMGSNFMLVEEESLCSVFQIVMRNDDFFLQRKNLNKYKFKKLWIAFSEKNCLSKYKAYNLGNFSTFADTLKILHPQCIAISVCTLPGFIKDLSLGQVPLLRNYRSALVIQITFLLSKLKVILKKSYLSHLSTDCNH